MSGLLILVSGPSGVGKGTLVKRFVDEFPKVKFVLSHTTREIREGEQNGVSRYFVSDEKFKRMIDAGEFLEWAKVYDMEYYGTAEKSIVEPLNEGLVLIKEVDVQGLELLKKRITAENIFSVFVAPDDVENLRFRIEGRGHLPDEEVKRRLQEARLEIEKSNACDYVLVNKQGHFEEAYEEFRRVVLAETEKKGLHI